MLVREMEESEKNVIALKIYANAKKYIGELSKSELKKAGNKSDFEQDLVTAMWENYDKFDKVKGSRNEFEKLIFDMVKGMHTFDFKLFFKKYTSYPSVENKFDRSISYKEFSEKLEGKNFSPLITADYLNLDVKKIGSECGLKPKETLQIYFHDNNKFINAKTM